MPRVLIMMLVVVSVTLHAQSSNLLQPTEKNPQQSRVEGYVFDIMVENTDQLSRLLQRADQLRGQFDAAQFGRIALVLHGEELQVFRKKNYSQFMSIVETAKQLDQQNLVDIKACQTTMRNMQIEQSELPDFIEQVPLAPVEIERLVKQKRYTRL